MAAAAYEAYASRVSDALQALLAATKVDVKPAAEFVSCGAGAHEHFVPKTSLEKHLRKCHGERLPRPIHNASFYYGGRKGEKAAKPRDAEGNGALENRVEAGAEDIQHGDLQSLLEPNEEKKASDGQEEGVIAAIKRLATSAGSFYHQVQAWRRIPRGFGTMKDNERGLVTALSLRRWLTAELSRPGVFPGGDLLDEDLVEYVAGLLDHPDFCQPDLLLLELHEFLGNSVRNIVLGLWKFLVIEIGLHSVFKTKASDVNKTIQRNGEDEKCETVAQSTSSPTLQTKPNAPNVRSAHDYKRRRVSYRGKVGTKTGPAAFREMIQKHMIGLSLEMDRELVLGGGFRDDDDSSNDCSKKKPARRETVNWRSFTDALEVRNRSRPRREYQSSRTQRRSRSRGRSSTIDAMGRAQHSGASPDSRPPERYRGRSRSRSRNSRHDEPDHRHRRRMKRSTSVERNNHRRRGYYRR